MPWFLWYRPLVYLPCEQIGQKVAVVVRFQSGPRIEMNVVNIVTLQTNRLVCPIKPLRIARSSNICDMQTRSKIHGSTISA
jgi:hypothetical protein